MDNVLYDYILTPITFRVGVKTEFTIRPVARKNSLRGEFRVDIMRIDRGGAVEATVPAVLGEDGCLRFEFTAKAECKHAMFVSRKKESDEYERCIKHYAYALEDDLADRIPLRGDLHIHTCRSDGWGEPALVCANYRCHGYDFIVVTDHHRYYPSLEAIKAYKDVDMSMRILPGEEVHLPGTDVHIVNAGGKFSVNGLFADRDNYKNTGGSLEGRRFDDSVTPPDIVTPEQYARELDEIERTLDDCPEDVDRRSFAVCVWAFEKIRQAEGIGIFAHPYWRSYMWQIPESFTRYMLRKHPFDAFEVLGGENYYEQNGFQTALYYDEYREGRIHPIVGSTDSHDSNERSRNYNLCSTIVFAEENTREGIIRAVSDRYSVAVDTISAEYRIVGDFRLQKYASFLLESYYPLHDRLTRLDGEMMRLYHYGAATAEEVAMTSRKVEAFITSMFYPAPRAEG